MSVATSHLKDPQQLYLAWEHSHWAAQDIDLSRDPGATRNGQQVRWRF